MEIRIYHKSKITNIIPTIKINATNIKQMIENIVSGVYSNSIGVPLSSVMFLF